jgi:hypothetical protein
VKTSVERSDRADEGQCLGNLSIVYRKLGDYKTALGLAEELLAVAREVRDQRGKAYALGSLGIACILVRFQDDTNNGKLDACQDHVR